MTFSETKFVAVGFYLLLFLVPLALFPDTSEIFEFNKIVLVYILTVFILALWAVRMIAEKKIVFRRSILDIPILLFLASQVASTYLSIDPRTSLFGYYSRFNGGLISLFLYALLYWAYVSNMTAKESRNSLIALLASSYLVGVYAFLQKLGVDRNIWDQNVQERVFSTFGQPNWLAAWLVAIIPLTWAYTIFNLKNKRFLLSLGLFIFLFLALLFTKSRSGLLGFLTAYATFWGILLLIKRVEKKLTKVFALITFSLLVISLVVGTVWTPNLKELASGKEEVRNENVSGEGGTESGQIRKIVWNGAIKIWKAYPINGTGVETFAFSYPTFRPAEHNLVSEWEFIYNKAHNEYLNFLATTGIFGLGAYLLIIFIFTTWVMLIYANKNSKFMRIRILAFIHSKFAPHSHEHGDFKPQTDNLVIGLFAGYTSILVTNFFGFSTVPVSILFFLYPAIAIQLTSPSRAALENKSLRVSSPLQKLLVISLLLVTSFLLLVIFRYWYADYLYAQAKAENDSGNYTQGGELMLKAIKLSRGEAIYYDELARSSAGIAVQVSEASDTGNAEKFAQQAIALSDKAIKLSPRNITLRKHLAGLYIKLTAIDTSYLYSARDVMAEIAPLAPTDAKLFYNLGLTLARTGEAGEAIKILKKAVELKPDFRDARFTIALLEIENGNLAEAKTQLEYILNSIDPDDILAKQQLEELGF